MIRTVGEHLTLVRDPVLRGILERSAAEFDATSARFDGLRRSAIHNDANDHNVLVNRDGDLFARGQCVVGLIDFGDIVHSYMIGDLAVAIAYAVLGKRIRWASRPQTSLPAITRCSR